MEEIIIKTTPVFDKKAKKQMSEEAVENLYDFLAENPKSGSVIRGTGGIRKLRWRSGRDNKGKSGSLRVLYHFSHDVLIILITTYSKSEKESITQKEKQELKRLMPQLIKKYLEV